jgi:universal stress protein E
MTASKRILVVIDPTAKSQPGLERAVWLAKRLPATLELFICDYDAHLAETRMFEAAALAKARDSLIGNHRRNLQDLARPLVADGVQVTVDVRWEYPLHEGIVRKAAESKADMVVKDTHYHSVLKRSIFSNTDWNLLRNCAATLLLVKPRAMSQRPCVVAAVDPLHERDKPAELDHRILAAAEELCSALGGELHVFHAFDIAPVLAASADSLTMPIALPVRELTDSLKKEHSAAVYALSDAHSIARDRVHIHQGGTRQLLVTLTEQLRADLVVMGAVSRNRLQRLFLGSTAEEVLDKLGCDLLIVKPAGFEAAHAD